LPAPLFEANNSFCIAIAQRVARLICTTPEFADLWQTVFPGTTWDFSVAATDPAEREKLRAEIDGLVAHLYNLDEEEFQYILTTFPQIEQNIKDAVLQAYRDFALTSAQLELFELISQRESQTLEFKVAACWNAYKGQKDDTMCENVLEEIVAFLNSREGGTVLIGVADDGTVIGLEDDFRVANPKRQNRDGYELYLANNIRDYLQDNWSLFYTISFATLENKDICRIDVQPAPKAVYTKQKGEFYIREGGRKRKLSPKETVDYIGHRWP